MTSPFKAHDAKQVSRLGNKPLAITWGRRGISWNALQMWNASVVLFDPKQDEMDVRTVNNMMFKEDYTVKRANQDKWVRQIIDAHIKGTGFRAFQDGDSTAWPKITRGDVSSISIIDLTGILLEHRQQVRAWAMTRKVETPKPPPEVPEPVTITQEVTFVQPEEVPDNWDDEV